MREFDLERPGESNLLLRTLNCELIVDLSDLFSKLASAVRRLVYVSREGAVFLSDDHRSCEICPSFDMGKYKIGPGPNSSQMFGVAHKLNPENTGEAESKFAPIVDETTYWCQTNGLLGESQPAIGGITRMGLTGFDATHGTVTQFHLHVGGEYHLIKKNIRLIGITGRSGAIGHHNPSTDVRRDYVTGTLYPTHDMYAESRPQTITRMESGNRPTFPPPFAKRSMSIMPQTVPESHSEETYIDVGKSRNTIPAQDASRTKSVDATTMSIDPKVMVQTPVKDSRLGEGSEHQNATAPDEAQNEVLASSIEGEQVFDAFAELNIRPEVLTDNLWQEKDVAGDGNCGMYALTAAFNEIYPEVGQSEVLNMLGIPQLTGESIEMIDLATFSSMLGLNLYIIGKAEGQQDFVFYSSSEANRDTAILVLHTDSFTNEAPKGGHYRYLSRSAGGAPLRVSCPPRNWINLGAEESIPRVDEVRNRYIHGRGGGGTM
jgi:hypothetical protein